MSAEAEVIYLAEWTTFDEFKDQYKPTMASATSITGENALFGAVKNKDVSARVAITELLILDGADASSVIGGNQNVLHVLFGRRAKHDPVVEAPMVAQLLAAGANINLESNRHGPPLTGLIKHGPPDSECGPLYEVIFGWPALDVDIPSERGSSVTLRSLIMGNALWQVPLMREYMLAADAKRSEA